MKPNMRRSIADTIFPEHTVLNHDQYGGGHLSNSFALPNLPRRRFKDRNLSSVDDQKGKTAGRLPPRLLDYQSPDKTAPPQLT